MNELDDIFKDAALAEKATFKPEYWDQYAEQFNGEKKKRKGVFGFFLAEILFVSCIVLIAANNSFDTNEMDLVATNTSIETVKSEAEELKNSLINNGLSANLDSKKDDDNKNTVSLVSVSNVSSEVGVSKVDVNNATRNSLVSVNATSFEPANNNSVSRNPLVQSINESNRNNNGMQTLNEIANNSTLLEKGKKEEVKEPVQYKSDGSEAILSEKTSDSSPAVLIADKSGESQDEENEEDTALPEDKPKKKSSVVDNSKMKKLQFNFQLGGIIYNDFSLRNNVQDIKTGLFAGVEVEYLLKPNLTVSLGVNGFKRTSDGLFIDIDFIDNGFGEVNSKKSYSYTDLYYIEVPVNLNYVINSRHKIGAGPTFTRLLTTKVNVNEETKDAKISANTVRNSNEYLYHYNTFELNNLGINVNYQFMFKRIGVNLGYTQGLNEFLNKETFNSSRFNTLNKLNISIKYRL